jgi:hypothetical protein
MKKHREITAEKYKGKGRAVISLDWTQAYHERGASIYGVAKAYDYVNNRQSFSKSEKYSFANGFITFGQKVHSIVRQAWHSLLSLANNLLIFFPRPKCRSSYNS